MTSSNWRLSLPALFLVAVTPAFASAQGRTAADIESARQLYNQGIELRDKGDMKGALEKFRAAHALGNTPVTGVELCKAHAALKQPVEAREICLGVARIPPTAQETGRSQEARSEAAKIAEEQKPKIGSIRIKLTGVPKGREPTVTVDGVSIPPAALNEPRAVNAGTHQITAKVGNGAETRATMETKEGENRDLELTVQPPPEGDTGPDPVVGPGPGPTPPPEKKSSVPTVLIAVGGVAATIGVISGLVAISGEGKLDDKCPQKKCGTNDHDQLDSALAWSWVSTVSFVVAAGALGAGFVTMATSSSSKGSLPPPTKNAQAKSHVKLTPVIGPIMGLHGSF